MATVAPPTRIFTNKILYFRRGLLAYGHVTLIEEFQADMKFFQDLLLLYIGISILQKSEFGIHDTVKLDACLTVVGACVVTSSTRVLFPKMLWRSIITFLD